MKRTWMIVVPVMIGILAVWAVAQDTNLEIYNETGTSKRICFYEAADKVAMIAFRCETVGARSTINTNINNVDFTVRVFDYGVKELYNQANNKNIERIVIGNSSASFKTRPAKPPGPNPDPNTVRYVLRVCNKSRPEKIDFVLAFRIDTGTPHFTYGWWSVEKDKCLDFPVSTMLYADWSIPYGTKVSVFYYGRISVPKTLVFEGNGTSCMDVNNAFKIKVSDLNFDRSKWDAFCTSIGPTLTRVGVRPLQKFGNNSVMNLDF